MKGAVNTITITLLLLIVIAASSGLFVYISRLQNQVVAKGETQMISLNTPPKLISLICFDGYGYMKLALTQGQDEINGKVLYSVKDDTGKLLKSGYVTVVLRDTGTVYIPYLFDKGSRYKVRLAGKNWQVDDYCTAVNDPHLILYLPFDEGSGTTANDGSYYEHDGTINGASWTEGYSGNALSFDGLNDYVDLGDVLNMSSKSFTLFSWIYPQGSGVSGRVILSKGGYQTLQGYSIFLKDTNHLGFDVSNGTSYVDAISSGTPQSWSNVVLVWNSSAKNATLYLDDLFDTSAVNQTVGAVNSAAHLFIGRRNSQYFNGTIDEVRIYDRALSSDEINALYEAYSNN